MKKEYDIIIIGGGATGSGIALDATLRGYKTLLLEKDDFSSKTSSNSTKLVHGGVRYLEKAVLQCNLKQFSLVKQALQERYYFLHNCQNMSHKLPIYSIVSNYFERFYLYIGLKLYDFLSFNSSLGTSEFFNSLQTKLNFPFLNTKQEGSIGFYDGAFNDMKVNIALIQSAQKLGCDIYNYHEVQSFVYDKNKLSGLKVFDKIHKHIHTVHSSVIINATGYFCDTLRQMDDTKAEPIITYSKGSHIVLESKYCNNHRGIIFQKTSDNRVLFILPWQNHTLVGTTEVVSKIEHNCHITEDEIDYLLKNLNQYLQKTVTKKDILSHFSSIRPLLTNNDEKNSENIVREHLILKSNSNLISITGGKWTTYRKMAQECLDFIIHHKLLKRKMECQTKNYKLFGNDKKICIKDLKEYNLSDNCKEHLIYHYGDNVFALLEEFSHKKYLEPLDTHYPFIMAELFYCMKYEYVYYPNDFLFRRIAIGKMNLKITQKILAKVVETMAFYYQWSDDYALEMYQKSLKETNELLQSI